MIGRMIHADVSTSNRTFHSTTPPSTHQEDVMAGGSAGAHLQAVAGPADGQAQLEVGALVGRWRRGARRRWRAGLAGPGHDRCLPRAWAGRGGVGKQAVGCLPGPSLQTAPHIHQGCRRARRGGIRAPQRGGSPGQGSPQLEFDQEGATLQVASPTHRPAT